MTDRELLELAAKAAGLSYTVSDHGVFLIAPYMNPLAKVVWNPLTDDGDALRLAGALGLVVDCSRPSAGLPYEQHAIWLDEMMGTAELIRRAIVRAAAELGR